MRLLVIGSSDTGGGSLADPALAYPRLVGQELGAAIGEAIEVVNLPVVHVGPKAVPRVVDALGKHQPDIVIFGYGAYAFIIATVANRVRRRYGERAYRFYHKIERRFETATASPIGGEGARLNRWGRWLAHRVIGAETQAGQEEVTGIQVEILRELSQRERLIVVMLGAPDVPASLVRDNKMANVLLDEHRKRMTHIAIGHRFLIADCVDVFRAAPERETLSTSDGIHKSAAGHRIQADAIMQTLLSPPSPLVKLATAVEAP